MGYKRLQKLMNSTKIPQQCDLWINELFYMNPFSNMILLGKLDLFDFYISTMIRFFNFSNLNPNDTLSEPILSSNLADYF